MLPLSLSLPCSVPLLRFAKYCIMCANICEIHLPVEYNKNKNECNSFLQFGLFKIHVVARWREMIAAWAALLTAG